MFHCILTITMVIFDRFWYFFTFGNRNEYSTKHIQTVSLQFDYVSNSPIYLVKLKITPNQLTAYAVRSVEPIVPDFPRKSFNVRFFSCLLENPFSSLPTKNLLHSRVFYQNLSSNSIWLILTCKLQLNCRDLWRVTVITLSLIHIWRCRRRG